MASTRVSVAGDGVELQSLRGLAALVVLGAHSLVTLDVRGSTDFLYTKVLSSHAAVALFFVLSGYVLAKSLARRGLSANELRLFYARRVFRIFPALWVGVSVTLALTLLLAHLKAPHLAPGIQAHFAAFPPPVVILGSYAGSDARMLVCLWTITVELAAALALPWMVWVAAKGFLHGVGLIVVLAVVAMLAGSSFKQIPLYLIDFAFGVVLSTIPAARLNLGHLETALAAAVLIWSHLLLPQGANWVGPTVLLEGIGAFFLLAGVVNGSAAWLRARPLVRLGDWSYSVYLIHLPVAFAVSYLLDASGLVRGSLTAWAFVVLALTATITIPVAALLYRYVELPGIALGKLAIRLRPASAQPVSVAVAPVQS
jgi:peptidoglycan/LPS O-acetylase OafA/YrhL